MASDDDVNQLNLKLICHKCIGEAYLKDEVQRKGRSGNCSYCGRRARSYSIGDIADRIESAFEQHYRRTLDQPTSWQLSLLADRESDYDWERDGEPVEWAIANAADIPEKAAQDIQTILEERFFDFDSATIGEETEFSSGSYYEEKGPSDQTWQEEWRNFERSLKTEARFFSRTAASHLSEIFGNIDKMATIDGRQLVIDAGPQTTLTTIFRARVFQSDEKLKEALCRPDLHLGPPSAAFASAGRMNARGISVFYGATDPGVAIAEVRPPVGSRAAVACFDIIRPLRLLDLTALETAIEHGSIFDYGWAARLERVTFLRSLCQRITQPVMPDDEALEYLPTQAIADFLATENEPVLDGIVFPSVQVAGDGLNVVLFHKAARVEAMAIPDGAKIEAHTGFTTEDGWEIDYTVYEQVPPKNSPSVGESKDQLFEVDAFTSSVWRYQDADYRDSALRINLDTVKVHAIRSVSFQCDVHDVSRHRLEKDDPEF